MSSAEPPRIALIVQAAITIGLVVFGAFAHDGFRSIGAHGAGVLSFPAPGWHFPVCVPLPRPGTGDPVSRAALLSPITTARRLIEVTVRPPGIRPHQILALEQGLDRRANFSGGSFRALRRDLSLRLIASLWANDEPKAFTSAIKSICSADPDGGR